MTKTERPETVRRSPSPVAARILKLLLGLTVVLVAVEFGARTYLMNMATDEQFLEFASLNQLLEYPERVAESEIILPHRYVGYIPTPNYHLRKNMHNSRGFRGEEVTLPKPENEFRIVCLGGSTTYTTKVDDYRQSYPANLEAILRERGHENVRVINAGSPGYTSWETLATLEFRVLELDPDMIIVYHGVNDLTARVVWPPAAYLGDNSGQRLPPSGVVMPGVLEHSTALRMLMIMQGWSEPHASFDRVVYKSPPSHYASDLRLQVQNGQYPSGIFKKVGWREMVEANPPIYFRQNLENVVAIAKMHGIEVILSSFAYASGMDPVVDLPGYTEELDAMNVVTAEVAEDTGAYFLDFAAEFPKDAKFFTDGMHVTVGGSHLKARLFADFIEERSLLPSETH